MLNFFTKEVRKHQLSNTNEFLSTLIKLKNTTKNKVKAPSSCFPFPHGNDVHIYKIAAFIEIIKCSLTLEFTWSLLSHESMS